MDGCVFGVFLQKIEEESGSFVEVFEMFGICCGFFVFFPVRLKADNKVIEWGTGASLFS